MFETVFSQADTLAREAAIQRMREKEEKEIAEIIRRRKVKQDKFEATMNAKIASLVKKLVAEFTKKHRKSYLEGASLSVIDLAFTRHRYGAEHLGKYEYKLRAALKQEIGSALGVDPATVFVHLSLSQYHRGVVAGIHDYHCRNNYCG